MYIYSYIHLRFTMYSIVCLSVTLCIGFTEYGLTENSFTNRDYLLQLSHKTNWSNNDDDAIRRNSFYKTSRRYFFYRSIRRNLSDKHILVLCLLSCKFILFVINKLSFTSQVNINLLLFTNNDRSDKRKSIEGGYGSH